MAITYIATTSYQKYLSGNRMNDDLLNDFDICSGHTFLLTTKLKATDLQYWYLIKTDPFFVLSLAC